MPYYDTDCQVSNLWISKTPKLYAGKVRDTQGNPLFGFKVQDTSKNRKVSIINNGHYMSHYRFPKGLNVPKHPMIRWINTAMSSSYLEDENGNVLTKHDGIIQAVLNGKKPVGEVLFRKNQKDECDAFIENTKNAGFEVFARTHFFDDSYLIVMFGVNKPIKELFNLEEIAKFYTEGAKWACFDKILLSYFRKMENLTPVQALQTYSWIAPGSYVELILTGLCLGYALESTLALIKE